MELRQLLYFVTVAEELHFTRAARRLNMTQPPLSLQIQRLEEELELRLFERSKRSVKLTPAGAALFDQAVAILEKVDYARDLCRRTQLGEVGELAIGFIPIALDLKLLDIIRIFRDRFAEVRLSLFEMGTNVQLEALRRGKIMLGFIQTHEHDLRGLGTKRVVSEPYLLAIPADHDLARRRRIPVKALKDVNLILPPRPVQPALHDSIVGSCREAGFEPSVEFEVYGKHTALTLTANGLGVTPVSKSYLRNPPAGVVFRPIEPAWPKMEVTMIWHPESMNPVLQEFLALAG